MAQKSKAASLTGSLLAPKGTAEPAESSPQATDNAGPDSRPAPVAQIDAPSGEAEAPAGGRVHFPLRLDPAEHLELRLAAARTGKSCQQLIVEALARYLAEIAGDSGDAMPPRTGGPE